MKRVIGVECWADAYFFGRLIKQNELIRKEKNKPEVFKSIFDRSKDSFNIGIVDNDGEKIESFLREYVIEQRVSIGGFGEVLKIAGKPWFIIQLAPVEFENWVAKFLDGFCERKLVDFGYGNIKEFCADSKVTQDKLLRKEKLLGVFNYVLQEFEKTDNYIKQTKRILEYLVNSNYQADLNKIANG